MIDERKGEHQKPVDSSIFIDGYSGGGAARIDLGGDGGSVVVVEKFGSLWFEPEPPRTEHKVQFGVRQKIPCFERVLELNECGG